VHKDSSSFFRRLVKSRWVTPAAFFIDFSFFCGKVFLFRVSSFQHERDFMLVLSRKKNENIVIGDDVKVYIVDIRGDTVRLGIVAPDDVSIHRNEVYEAIKDQYYGRSSTQKRRERQ